MRKLGRKFLVAFAVGITLIELMWRFPQETDEDMYE